MNAELIDPLLLETLADAKLSQAEKKKLVEFLNRHAPDENARAFVRHRAFELARQEFSRKGFEPTLIEWLEDTVKTTLRPTSTSATGSPGTSPTNRAFFSPGEACLNEILRQIQQAKKSCDLCVFTITDDRIAKAIAESHGRGVTIRVITDNDKANDLGSDIGRLMDLGIECRVDKTTAHMHHKFAIFDGVRLLNGSFNWTRSATSENRENIVISDDPQLVRVFATEFEKIWNELA